MKRKEPAQTAEKLFPELAQLSSEALRKTFLARHRALLRASVVEKLSQIVRERVRVDMQEALNLAEGAAAIAAKIKDPLSLGLGLRAKANVLYVMGRNQEASSLHEEALKLFQKVGNQIETARTMSVSLQPLTLLGEYDRALALADQAREIFTQLGDELRLARLEINVANVYHRQDRFAEALERYERAYEKLLPLQENEGIAVALHNMAVCLISLNDFHRALDVHTRVRAFCEEHGMPLLVAQADYNIAWLHYVRGEYSQAIEMLRAARESCEKNGDLHHLALCYLDLSEIYLELNLSEEAVGTAQESAARFEKLGMGYEAAKSQAYLAMAAGQLGKSGHALELFVKARALFVREKNHVWPSVLDLYQALVLYNEGRYFEARRLCVAALEFFLTSPLSSKAVLCRLLLARLHLKTGEPADARKECTQALEVLSQLDAPVLHCQAYQLMGQIQEAEGNFADAFESVLAARHSMEALRSGLHSEELKITFMKNKSEVYETLVHLCLGLNTGAGGAVEAFGYMEQAKSRTLHDLLFRSKHSLPSADPGQSPLVRKIRGLREELNWFYHRIEEAKLSSEIRSPEQVEKLEAQAREQEKKLLRVLREAPAEEAEKIGLRAPAPAEVDTVRSALGPDAALVEYFRVRDRMIATVVTGGTLEIVPLTLVSRVTGFLRLLQFQLSKFRLGMNFVRNFESSLLEATQAHLKELHEEILAPLLPLLNARHLVIVPHDVLHYLPFHALYDGEQYLIDRFTISYAPSAGIFALCQEKPAKTGGSSLILGVPDQQAPSILDEVQSVAATLQKPELFLGTQAGQATLKEKGPAARIIHLATHGYFRQDNPMFSAIRLGDSYLSLYDLYQFKLPAELVTLSGCATGINALSAGDELLGLVRGLLYAGAHSLLLTMWDVNDRSTSEFMKMFYRRFSEHANKALALQEAMQGLRETYPHPYYWAPFLLVGKISDMP